MLIAITREVSPNISRCVLTHLGRETIDVKVAQAQHRQYELCLAALGCQVRTLSAEPELPDAVFVEDTAIVLDELAIIARPGDESRRLETASVADALRPYRPLSFIEPPGTIDGGDVLHVGRRLLIGLSHRSNAAGIEQMRGLLAPFGYIVQPVPVQGCLHLKSAVTLVAKNTLLINRDWVDSSAFGPRHPSDPSQDAMSADVPSGEISFIDVDPAEPFAANALLVGDTVIYPAAYSATCRRLLQRGLSVQTVDVSELAKAEGGVTCCSLLLTAN